MGYIPTMPYSRFLPPLLIALLLPLAARAQAPAPPAGTEPPSLADNVITEAIIKLRLREKIAAEIVQDVEMLNQKFSLEGNYFKDTGYRLRLELKLKGLGDSGSTLLQVCDGQILWDYKMVLGMGPIYNRRDITLIFKRLQDPALDDAFRNLISTNLGFGGPEAMLSGLQKAIKFDQFAEEKVDGVETFKLGGTWRDRTGLMGPNDRPLGPTDRLPPYIPSNVQLFVEKTTLWPYKIVMIGNAPLLVQEDTRAIGPDGRPIGVKRAPPKVDPSRITLSYKLLPTTEIKPELFLFAAPPASPSLQLKDDTEDFLGELDKYIQRVVAEKKAEAAKAEGEPLFKAPVEVPAVPGSEPTAPLPTPK